MIFRFILEYCAGRVVRRLWFYPLALMSLSYGVVDSNKIFTQDTTLDSSYANITTTPISGQGLVWGEIRGGSKDSPITLSTKQPLVISAITHDNGGAGGIFLTTKSYARLQGDITFSTLSSNSGAMGVFESGFITLINEGHLAFKEILGGSGVAMGVSVATLIQKGSLELGKIDGGLMGTGVWAYRLDNQAGGSITLQELASADSVTGVWSLIGRNSGSIGLNSIQGDEVIGVFSSILLNEGEITLGDLSSQTSTTALVASGIDNLGTINVSSLSSKGASSGIEASLDNQGEIVFDKISAGSDAIGIHGDVQNTKSITFNSISAKNSAKGIYWGDLTNEQGGVVIFKSISGDNLAVGFDPLTPFSVNSGTLRFESITSKKMAIGFNGTLHTPKGASTTFGTIQAPKAVGIYQDSFSNEVGGGGNIVFENIIGAESYGIFIDASGGLATEDVDSSIIHFKNIQSNVGIKNLGKMNIYNDAFVFAPSVPTQNNSAIYSDMANAEFYLNTIKINTPYDYGFYAKQDAKVYIQASQANINAGKYSFGGEVNLTLSNQAELTLQSGGDLKSLNANQSKLIINNDRYSKRLTIHNFQAQDNVFTLNVDFNGSQSVSYDGGEVYENGTKITKGVSSLLYIDSTNTTSKLDNTLSITLDSKSNVGKKYILLAQVVGANKDNIIFNSLSNGQTTSITTGGKYTTDTLLLGRYDDTLSNYYYLIADTFQAQETPTPNPPTPNPTPSQPTKVKEKRNALIYSPSQSLLFATFDWGKSRFEKLRSDNHTGRFWVDLGAEYWKYNSSKTCNETFVDFSIGGDYLFSFAKGRNVVGLAFEISGGFINQYFDLGEIGEGLKINSGLYALALYDALMLDNGIYSHTVVKIGGGSSEFDKNKSSSKTLDQNEMIASLSERVGKRFFFFSHEGMFVDLSAIVAVGYTEAQSFLDEEDYFSVFNQGVRKISSSASFLNQNKVEVLLGYQNVFNSFFSFDLSAGVGFVSNHCIGGEMVYETQKQQWEFENTPYVGAVELSANLVMRMGERLDAYVSIASAWSKQYNEVIDFSAGVKLRFGTL